MPTVLMRAAMRIAHATAIAGVLWLSATLAADPPPGASCARQLGLVGPCFSVRGRLSLYNGNPSARIWKIGSKRILGITESRCVEPECSQMPEELRKMLNWEEGIYADFLVCPFTESKPDHMQFVCIESARNVHVRKLQ